MCYRHFLKQGCQVDDYRHGSEKKNHSLINLKYSACIWPLSHVNISAILIWNQDALWDVNIWQLSKYDNPTLNCLSSKYKRYNNC